MVPWPKLANIYLTLNRFSRWGGGVLFNLKILLGGYSALKFYTGSLLENFVVYFSSHHTFKKENELNLLVCLFACVCV